MSMKIFNTRTHAITNESQPRLILSHEFILPNDVTTLKDHINMEFGDIYRFNDYTILVDTTNNQAFTAEENINISTLIDRYHNWLHNTRALTKEVLIEGACFKCGKPITNWDGVNQHTNLYRCNHCHQYQTIKGAKQ